MSRTLTRADIVDSLIKEINLPRSLATEVLEELLTELIHAAVQESGVKISSFGSFIVREKSQRIGRNPKTGEEAVISPRRVITFRPSQCLKEAVHFSHKKAA